MHLTLVVTEREIAAAMKYHGEIEKMRVMIASAVGDEYEVTPSNMPAKKFDVKEKAYAAKVEYGPKGITLQVVVEPEFVADFLDMYCKAAAAIAIPFATFVMAFMMTVKNLEGGFQELFAKWETEPIKKKVSRNKHKAA